MNKRELLKTVEDIEITYDYEDTYNNLYNACVDYMNETQDWSLEYLFEDYCSYDTAEEIAKNELDNGGLVRLYYFLGDANLNNELFKIDGYGNLTDIDRSDLEYLQEEIIDNIKNDLEDSEEESEEEENE